ncbi:MAG: alpha-hydroxy-acid oxidizing protein [Solirubrobacterales bacterium]|nr:alpha-hydroxy-acid oxidizing protein [Solirubrobacterales bacterium]
MPTTPDRVGEPLNLLELEERAAAVLEPLAYDYYRSGAGAEVTLERNQAAFGEIELLPRVLVDVDAVDPATTLLGTPMAHPIVVAPTAFHRLAHPEGEVATARGAAAAGAVMCLSSLSNTPLEEVAAAAGPRWFQLYVFRDRGVTRDLVARAEASGFEAIVLTVDAPVLGRRERDVRNEFALPEGLRIACVPDGEVVAPAGGSGLAAYVATMIDASLDWDDLEWLASITDLPVAVKGIHRPDDAERAVAAGAAGVIVSNHGGRQLDTVPATIEMLPAIAQAVDGRADVLVDSGVRRGTDVIKALALGAGGVLIGRPVVWGLALDGAEGVRRTVDLLVAETREAMMLCGARDLAGIGADLLA